MSSTPSALVLTVPEADEVVERLRPPADPDAQRMPAHVTLLHPFVPDPDEGVVEELRFFFARVDGFALTFSAVRELPGIVWLDPDEAAEVRGLTEALTRRWPSCRPDDGAFEQITPRLTVARTDDPARMAELRDSARAALPLRARASEASLWLREPEGWRKLAAFALGEGD